MGGGGEVTKRKIRKGKTLTSGMEESGEQCNVVFAFIVTEPASECACAEGLLYSPPPTSRSHNNLRNKNICIFINYCRRNKGNA
jgi:hypothetical protein